MGAIDSKLIEGIARLPLLDGLEARTVGVWASGATILALPRGSVIYRQGESCTGLHLILTGQVTLSVKANDAHEKVFDLLGPGACFGEPSLFSGQVHQMTAEATAAAELVHVATAQVLKGIAHDSALAARIIAHLAGALYRRTGELKSMVLYSGTQRVICYLLHAVPDALQESGDVVITLPTRKGIIASKLNLTQEHFSRILHELAAAGLIEVHGHQVRIPDIARLRMRAVQ